MEKKAGLIIIFEEYNSFQFTVFRLPLAFTVYSLGFRFDSRLGKYELEL